MDATDDKNAQKDGTRVAAWIIQLYICVLEVEQSERQRSYRPYIMGTFQFRRPHWA